MDGCRVMRFMPWPRELVMQIARVSGAQVFATTLKTAEAAHELLVSGAAEGRLVIEI